MPDPLDAPSFAIYFNLTSRKTSSITKRVLFSASRVKSIDLLQKGIVPVRYGAPNRFIARLGSHSARGQFKERG